MLSLALSRWDINPVRVSESLKRNDVTLISPSLSHLIITSIPSCWMEIKLLIRVLFKYIMLFVFVQRKRVGVLLVHPP
jgi:hypothetical protein